MNHSNKKNFYDGDLSRLKWACRRGMLELDDLLGYFLNTAYQDLCPLDQSRFVNLLNHSDPELLAWIMGHRPAPTEYQSLCDRIHTHARSRKL